MKINIVLIISAFSALVAAHPSPAQNHLLPRTNENGTDITTVDEPIPDFVLPCVCPPVTCDPRNNPKSLCECKASFAQACYLRSAGGCAMPKIDAC
ncbi:hypothetical protein VPNG_07065 [Cytospora leucostoma]|uniref:Extracellular membrane protein CFEM domain-containing protein n=1 Tax=Cytospora leucostoma TaxID=1230097 RepID=A0A423WVQ1_9PEZI|nr:hypothetical protein VPNG_07065 [Cytospora leucostoma]